MSKAKKRTRVRKAARPEPPRTPDISHEEFAAALESLVDEMSGAEILATPGAYEVFSEALNNEAIDRARKAKEEEEEDGED